MSHYIWKENTSIFTQCLSEVFDYFFYLNVYFSEVFNYFVLGQIWEYMGTVQNLVRSSYATVGDVGAAARGGELASGC